MANTIWNTGRSSSHSPGDSKSNQEASINCPDDPDYPCYICGERTSRGYDSGLCPSCTEEEE